MKAHLCLHEEQKRLPVKMNLTGQTQAWQATLELQFARDAAPAGATRLIARRHSGPLRVQKALYPESADVCHAIVVHPPGGVVGGDQLRIDMGAGERAHAFVTSPGAAKWYRANGRVSRQVLRFEVGEQASLEWLPQETIFYDEACVELNSEVRLAQDATFIGCDILCFGRTASGEAFRSGSVSQTMRIWRGDHLIWLEQGRLTAGTRAMSSAAGMGGKTVCATLIAAGTTVPSDVINAIRDELVTLSPLFGITQRKQLIVARYLGDSSEAGREAILAVWRHLRPALIGRAAVTPRIWNT